MNFGFDDWATSDLSPQSAPKRTLTTSRVAACALHPRRGAWHRLGRRYSAKRVPYALRLGVEPLDTKRSRLRSTSSTGGVAGAS